MVEWLVAHKMILLVGLGVGAAAYFLTRGGAPTAGTGLGGVNPGSSQGADPLSSQLTGLQMQLSNMMAGIASKLSGGSSGSSTPTSGTTTTTTTSPTSTPSTNTTPTAAPTVSGTPTYTAQPAPRIAASIATPLPVSGDAWQPPVRATAVPTAVMTVGKPIGMRQNYVPPAPVDRASSAYAGVSLGEGEYIRAPVPRAPAATIASRQNYVPPTPFHPPAPARNNIGMRQNYVPPAPAAAITPHAEDVSVTHGKITYQ